VRPKPVHREWIQNSMVVRQLLQSGTNRQKLHHIEHVFLGSPDALDEIARTLTARGLSDQMRLPDAVLLGQRLPLDVDAITTWTVQLSALAEELGGQYDGWGSDLEV
jgi:regulator of RNase E activity RraB